MSSKTLGSLWILWSLHVFSVGRHTLQHVGLHWVAGQHDQLLHRSCAYLPCHRTAPCFSVHSIIGFEQPFKLEMPQGKCRISPKRCLGFSVCAGWQSQGVPSPRFAVGKTRDQAMKLGSFTALWNRECLSQLLSGHRETIKTKYLETLKEPLNRHFNTCFKKRSEHIAHYIT